MNHYVMSNLSIGQKETKEERDVEKEEEGGRGRTIKTERNGGIGKRGEGGIESGRKGEEGEEMVR